MKYCCSWVLMARVMVQQFQLRICYHPPEFLPAGQSSSMDPVLPLLVGVIFKV